MSGVIRSMVVKIGADLTNLEKGLAKAQKAMLKTSKSLETAGKTLTNYVTKPIIALASSLTYMTLKSAASADTIADLASVMHVSASRVQELTAVGEILGMGFDGVLSAHKRLTRSMYDADQGNKDTIQAFADLGVAIYDTNGEMRLADDVFWDVIEALRQMENPTKADGIAMELMGRSASDLNPLIVAGKEGVEKFTEKLREMGLFLTPEEVAKLASLNDEFLLTKAAAKLAGDQIALEFEPILKDALKIIQDNLPDVTKKITDLMGKYKDLNPEQQEFFNKMLLFATFSGPTMLGLSAILKLLGGAGVLGGVIGAFMLLTATIGALYLTNDDFRDWVDNGIIWPLQDAYNEIMGLYSSIESLMKLMDSLKNEEKQGYFYEPVKGIVEETLKGINVTETSPKAKEIKENIDAIITKDAAENSVIVPAQQLPVDKELTVKERRLNAFAEGGILTAPQLVLAGEAGPEAIIPLDKLGGMGNDKAPNIIQVILDGRIIQEYTDGALGRQLSVLTGGL